MCFFSIADEFRVFSGTSFFLLANTLYDQVSTSWTLPGREHVHLHEHNSKTVFTRKSSCSQRTESSTTTPKFMQFGLPVSAAFAIQGEKITHKRKRRTEILTSTAADRVKDTKRKYNNQPNNHFNTCLGRVYLRCWRDWSAVALSVSHLVSGSFSSTRTQVDCFESLHIVQHFADGAKTFTYEAHGYRPASCIRVSCIGVV